MLHTCCHVMTVQQYSSSSSSQPHCMQYRPLTAVYMLQAETISITLFICGNIYAANNKGVVLQGTHLQPAAGHLCAIQLLHSPLSILRNGKLNKGNTSVLCTLCTLLRHQETLANGTYVGKHLLQASTVDRKGHISHEQCTSIFLCFSVWHADQQQLCKQQKADSKNFGLAPCVADYDYQAVRNSEM